MSWTWRYQTESGEPVTDPPAARSFATRSDAESWLGETWRDLLTGGVAAVTLLEDGRAVYGPMDLRAD